MSIKNKIIRKLLKKREKIDNQNMKIAISFAKNNKIVPIVYENPINYTITTNNEIGQIFNPLTANYNIYTNTYFKYINTCPMNNPKIKQNIYYTPNQITIAYGVNKLNVVKLGKGITVAVVIAFHYENLIKDFDTYCVKYNLPTSNSGEFNFRVISLGTVYNKEWAQECCLDVQAIHSIAPYANILVVEAQSNSFYDMLNAIKIAVQNNASVISMSWGGYEHQSVINMYNNYFKTISNVCFICASGDETNRVIFPSSSQHVLSIGGTNLILNNDNTRHTETPWYNSTIGSGNGYSKFLTKPSYQNNITIIKKKLRCTPDLSLIADPKTGFVVYFSDNKNDDNKSNNSNYFIFGGTSLATPLLSGMIAIANQIRKTQGKLFLSTNCDIVNGQVQKYIYHTIYKKNINYTNKNPRKNQYDGNFYDITLGDAGIFKASSGYDIATGLGSPNANVLCVSLLNA